MPHANYHSHTTFSDGKEDPEAYIEAAIQQNMQAFGFSDHAPVPFETNWTMKPERLEEYLNRVRQVKTQYQNQIEVYLGLEVDYIPGLIHPQMQQFESLDYTIGSVHYADQLANGDHWPIDGSEAEFKQGVNEIFGGSVQKALERYFELTREMLSKACPTILGHIDRIKMNNRYTPFFTEYEPWYQKAVIETLECMSATNAILEVNTKSYYRKRTAEPNPGAWILQQANALNIPVHLASDSHHPKDNIGAFDYGMKLLWDSGYRAVTILKNGVWQQVNITSIASINKTKYLN